MKKGPAACVSLLGSATPLAVIACSRSRLIWHVREEAGKHDGKASFLSKVNHVDVHASVDKLPTLQWKLSLSFH